MRQSNTAYRHFTDEEIVKANSVSLLDLSRQYGFEPESGGKKAVHLKHSGGMYIFPESNRFFQWISGTDGEKGGPVDFVMRQDNLSFGEAVGKLIGEDYVSHIQPKRPYEAKPREPLVLPDKAENFKRAYWYLLSVRGIESEIVSHFMNLKMIYQEAVRGNCVFVGYDTDGAAKYCSKRGTGQDSTFKMDATNSDKSYPFFHEGRSDLLIVNECPIDLLSHATLSKVFYGQDWTEDHRISLGCLWEGALTRYLQAHPQIKRLVFAVDNDYLARNKDRQLENWGQRAADKWCAKYSKEGYECAIHRPHLNDFNQDLTEMRKGRSPEELDRRREVELQAEFEKDTIDEDELEI